MVDVEPPVVRATILVLVDLLIVISRAKGFELQFARGRGIGCAGHKSRRSVQCRRTTFVSLRGCINVDLAAFVTYSRRSRAFAKND